MKTSKLLSRVAIVVFAMSAVQANAALGPFLNGLIGVFTGAGVACIMIGRSLAIPVDKTNEFSIVTSLTRDVKANPYIAGTIATIGIAGIIAYKKFGKKTEVKNAMLCIGSCYFGYLLGFFNLFWKVKKEYETRIAIKGAPVVETGKLATVKSFISTGYETAKSAVASAKDAVVAHPCIAGAVALTGIAGIVAYKKFGKKTEVNPIS